MHAEKFLWTRHRQNYSQTNKILDATNRTNETARRQRANGTEGNRVLQVRRTWHASTSLGGEMDYNFGDMCMRRQTNIGLSTPANGKSRY